MSVFSYLELVILFEVEKKFDGVKKKTGQAHYPTRITSKYVFCMGWEENKEMREKNKTKQTPAFF